MGPEFRLERMGEPRLLRGWVNVGGGRVWAGKWWAESGREEEAPGEHREAVGGKKLIWKAKSQISSRVVAGQEEIVGL